MTFNKFNFMKVMNYSFSFNKTESQFHMCNMSCWPVLMSVSLLSVFMNTISWMTNHNFFNLLISLFSMILISILWWRDVNRESMLGKLSSFMMIFFKLSMILFITSEVFFFSGFFWTYLHNSLNTGFLVNSWPTEGIYLVCPFAAPFLNSCLLLSSGLYLTVAHYLFMMRDMAYIKYMYLTLGCGVVFELVQIFEFYQTTFTMMDSIMGSIFFMSTGFHGLHVLVGLVMLIVMFNRLKKQQSSQLVHIGFISSIWYWHFVDVVWLMLYLVMYWWPW